MTGAVDPMQAAEAALVAAGVPAVAQTVSNILGDFAAVSSGNVALSGRATLVAAMPVTAVLSEEVGLRGALHLAAHGA